MLQNDRPQLIQGFIPDPATSHALQDESERILGPGVIKTFAFSFVPVKLGVVRRWARWLREKRKPVIPHRTITKGFMTTKKAAEKNGLHSVLAAPGRSPEIPETADLYGWLVGSWELEVRHYLADLGATGLKGEVHFGWVLEGRAVQDVWIYPPRSKRTAGMDKSMNTYGTTLRVWDGQIQAWRVTWINPVSGTHDKLIGRWSGKDVMQVGTRSDGTPIRWSFTEITANSFCWLGEALLPDGKTWKLEAEFRGRRMKER